MKTNYHTPSHRLSAISGLVFLLCSVNRGSAEFINYEWTYHAPGGAHVIGNFNTSGVEVDGFLLGSITGMTFRDIDDGSWSRWLHPMANALIPADGSNRGLSMNLEFDYLGNPAWLFIFQMLPNAPFENELGYIGTHGNLHTMEYVGNEFEWSISPAAIRVPEGGGTLALSLIAALPLLIFYRMNRKQMKQF